MKALIDKKSRRIGIFGGTFNPIHTGHLIIATFVLEEKGLDRILFVPCSHPPHKGRGELAPGEERLRMVELAVASDPRFTASDIELKRGGTSYSIRTVEDLRAIFGPGTRFFFIVGADSLHEISTWKEIERLSELCDFVTVARPGYSLEGLSPRKLAIGEGTFERLAPGIVRTPLVEISSTLIRDRVRAGKSIEYMVPAGVADHIREKGLYRKGGKENRTE